MMRRLAIHLGIALTLVPPFARGEGPPISPRLKGKLDVVQAGAWSDAYLPGSPAGEWWGLVTKGTVSELRKMKLTVENFRHEVFDSIDGPMTGRELKVPGPSPVLLLRGSAPFLNKRTIPIASWAASLDETETKIQLKHKKLTLVIGPPVVGPPSDPNAVSSTRRTVTITDGNGLRQRLFEDHGFTQLEWAGDLDGDGNLDLILAGYPEYETMLDTMLFLSSAATKGQLVGLAAVFHIPQGC